MRCWSATHPKNLFALIHPRLCSVIHALILRKALIKFRFMRVFERWIFPNRKIKALLIGIRKGKDVEPLRGPHDDVRAVQKLLISE